MTDLRDELRGWLKASLNATTSFAAAMIAVIWTGAYFHLSAERQQAEEAAFQTSRNLAQAFDAHVTRSIEAIDKALLFLRSAYEADPAHFDMKQAARDASFMGDIAVHFAISRADGLMIASNVAEMPSTVNLFDREHFQVHVHSSEDTLFIGKPVIGRTTGLPSMQLTRRVRNPDGSFGGVIAAAVNPDHFGNFYKSIDIGKDGSISLMGFDGVMRANGGLRINFQGQRVRDGDVLARMRQAPAGSFRGTGRVDGVNRLISNRVVQGYPLVVTVGMSENEILANYMRSRQSYYGVATALSVLILVAAGISTGNRLRLVRAHEALSTQNMRFETALDNMTQGLAMFDAKQRLVVCNEQYVRMYGLSEDEARYGTPLRRILESRIVRGIYAAGSPTGYLEMQLAPVTKYSFRVHELSDGRAIAVARQPMRGGGWVTTHVDVTEHQRAEAKIAYLARHDPLTGLANRFVFLEEIERAHERLGTEQRPFAAFLLDLDLFKAVNDTLGHSVGDALLGQVARRIAECVGDEDVVARLGGDEFAVLHAFESRDGLRELADRILARVKEPYEVRGYRVTVGSSIGIAVAPEDGDAAEHILKNADLALYRAKSEGRNRFCFFEPAMGVEATRKRELEIDLRDAVSQGELTLHYQRIIDVTDKRTCGVEALVRWRHPRHGMLPPDQFIPLAEEIGLIIPLGEWILRRACTDASTWPAHLKVAVNLSPIQFRQGDLVQSVKAALADSGLPPERLELEITESVLLEGNDANLGALRELDALGVSVVLDDFGIGYASLSYLRMFRFDKVKIDRSFVGEIADNTDCAAIVCAVAGLGRSLSIVTTAEGVETEEQFELLRAAGCTQAQGYLFGRPVPATELDLGDEEASDPVLIRAAAGGR